MKEFGIRGLRFSTYALDVLGCKVNQYDAGQIARLLEGVGLSPVMPGEMADLIVIHTCGVTMTAVKKSRQTLHRLIRQHPHAVVFLTGCATDDKLIKKTETSDVRIAAGPGWIQRLSDQLHLFSLPNPDFHLPTNPDELPAETFGKRTRAFLKIQDGCDAHCAYCIVPTLRKAPRDKSIDATVAEAKALVRCGCKEIVLTGVHIGLYGRGTDNSLSDVLMRLASIPDLKRIRLSSLHPTELTDELLTVWASLPKMMPHIHLSLQSGSDRVIRRMGRGYTTAKYTHAVMRARAVLNTPAITTDVIVGFPGETDLEFEETLEFCQQIGFARMHIFTYSPRPETRAIGLSHPVLTSVAQIRQRRLSALAEEMKATFNRNFIGKRIEVLVEGYTKDTSSGVSPHYIPVKFTDCDALRNTLVFVQIVSGSASGLKGTALQYS